MITRRLIDEWHVEASEFVNSIKQEFMESLVANRKPPQQPMPQPQQAMPQQAQQPMPQQPMPPQQPMEQEEVDYGES